MNPETQESVFQDFVFLKKTKFPRWQKFCISTVHKENAVNLWTSTKYKEGVRRKIEMKEKMLKDWIVTNILVVYKIRCDLAE